MKKVLLKGAEPQIADSDLNDSHFIGIEYSVGNRAFVQKLDPENYISAGFYNKKANDGYISKVVKKTIEDLVNNVGSNKVFVFDTAKELMQWIADGYPE